MHHITCHHLALSLVSDSLRLLRRLTRWSALERSTRCSDAPRRIRWAATSWPSRHWPPTHATTIKGGHNLKITTHTGAQDAAAASSPSSSPSAEFITSTTTANSTDSTATSTTAEFYFYYCCASRVHRRHQHRHLWVTADSSSLSLTSNTHHTNT